LSCQGGSGNWNNAFLASTLIEGLNLARKTASKDCSGPSTPAALRWGGVVAGSGWFWRDVGVGGAIV